ncbi:LysR family transcriptional regulator [Pseudacidovorax sp. NFM-22]|uniref:LysR family transcriptional regulator n=1 Tax=Pseudacidovorax sp. NFM-22 TaxID=2744469 RepID=UPI001F3AB50A|nr:LysR family transcriptional regulator [Pseudacidovorax sp. NFM-22]
MTTPPLATTLLNRLLARGKFRHVQVLLQLAELGSVQRTADAIGMTQSAVTQTLAYLERLLDVRLFERHARGVRPTPACNDLLPVARQLMLGMADVAGAVDARRRQGLGFVRVLASVSAIHGVLVDALPAFAEAQPAIRVQLAEAEGEDQLLAIARAEVDLVVCRRPGAMPQGWEFHALREDRFAVVCRADHPLLADAAVPGGSPAASLPADQAWAALAAHPWLLLPAGVAARGHFDALCERFGRTPPIYPVSTRSLPLMGWLLRHQPLLALLPLNLARPWLATGELRELALPDMTAIEPIGLLQPQSGMGEAALALSDFLRGRIGAGD